MSLSEVPSDRRREQRGNDRDVTLLASLLAAFAGCAAPRPPPATPANLPTGSAAGSGAAVSASAAPTSPAATPAVENVRAEQRAAEPPRPQEPVFPTVHAQPVADVELAEGDPVQGKFTLEDALAGLAGAGTALFANIATSEGTLECELWPDKAPITVANFVGLARGIRPWKKGNQWIKEPLYDGTLIHRTFRGYIFQGGDPTGTGTGGTGYMIPDEIWENAHHDRRGLLCMANRGPNTNGSQFFVLDGPAPHIDGSYTIFGFCSPEDVVQKLAGTPTIRTPPFDRPLQPPKIWKVVVRRELRSNASR